MTAHPSTTTTVPRRGDGDPSTGGPLAATGALLLGAALLSVVGYVVLGSQFGWPDVLDEPGTVALDAYLAAEPAVRAGFYLMALASLSLLVAAFGLHAVIGRDDAWARAVTAVGALGAFAQMLGWLRWVTAVPVQAELWTQAGADPVARHAVATAYDTLNAYAGATLGEHLGWLLQGIWAVGIGVLLLRTRQVPSWFGTVGLALATGWAVLVPIGTAADVAWAETLGVAVLYTVWFVWVGALGLLFLGRGRRRAGTG
jgi:Domain of unknown function (DUF4386)